MRGNRSRDGAEDEPGDELADHVDPEASGWDEDDGLGRPHGRKVRTRLREDDPDERSESRKKRERKRKREHDESD